MLGAPCWLTMTELLVDQWCLYVFESLPQTNPNTSLLWIILPHYFRLSLGDNKHYINWEKESFLLLLLTLHFGFNAHSGYVDCPCCYSSLILDFLSNLFQQSVLIYLVYQYNYIFCLTVICSRQSTSPATSRCPYLIDHISCAYFQNGKINHYIKNNDTVKNRLDCVEYPIITLDLRLILSLWNTSYWWDLSFYDWAKKYYVAMLLKIDFT